MFLSEYDIEILCNVEEEFLNLIHEKHYIKNEDGYTFLQEGDEEGERISNLWNDYWNVLDRLLTKNEKLKNLLNDIEEEG